MESGGAESSGATPALKKAPERGVELIIEDGDLATWMPINNAFALDVKDEARHPLEYWNGVVIPIGKYKEHTKEGAFLDVFGSVRIERAGGGAVRSLMGNLEWINIVRDAGASDSPHPWGARDDWRNLEDKLIERLKPRLVELTKTWLETYAMITYWWKGPGGYDISVAETFGSKGRRNSRYVFDLQGPARVRLMRRDALKPETLKEVSRIVVSSIRKGSGPNGGGIDPPPTRP